MEIPLSKLPFINKTPKFPKENKSYTWTFRYTANIPTSRYTSRVNLQFGLSRNEIYKLPKFAIKLIAGKMMSS